MVAHVCYNVKCEKLIPAHELHWRLDIEYESLDFKDTDKLYFCSLSCYDEWEEWRINHRLEDEE